MEVVGSESFPVSNSSNIYSNTYQNFNAKSSSDALILSSISENSSVTSTNVDLNFSDLYKSLTITSKQIVDKLNDILKNKLPNGLQSLKPEDVTPEASAENVVRGVTSMFTAFAKQNADLAPEELVKKFLEEAKKGVEQGYGDAKKVLQSLGALEIDGVENGISQTRELILQKLDKFAELKLEELTGKTPTVSKTAEITKEVLLQQGGGRVLDLAA